MKFRFSKWFRLIFLIALFLTIPYTLSSTDKVHAQQPTGSIPTVTGTPTGPTAKVDITISDSGGINIRSGPGTEYDVIGIMWIDIAMPIIGRSPGGNWILIKDPSISGGQGWVYSFNVIVSPGEIPVAEVPPTPLPRVTVAIDPTLAAQFITTPLATQLPTYTPAAPLAIPTYEVFNSQALAGIPVGLIILGLIGLGIVMALFSFITSR